MLIDSDLTSDNQTHRYGSYHFAHALLNGVMGQFESTLYSPYHLPEQGKLNEKKTYQAFRSKPALSLAK
ncbi:hypothetical protein Forpe1208_v009153 [Fusarium oxysporum f. sp. rapae]|uniref:Uncharacterized protein n=1 Tax=Fusarium oxysporum f. sp. rapae TaxID=485398 RepID=A0A8J5P6Y1_FUSOX|nr:hypothetical protein Forpe1208_v009153 [Fusarium oxysporum f. sp. rapae]